MCKPEPLSTLESSDISPRSVAGKTFVFPVMDRNLMDFISLLIYAERERGEGGCGDRGYDAYSFKMQYAWVSKYEVRDHLQHVSEETGAAAGPTGPVDGVTVEECRFSVDPHGDATSPCSK